MKTYRVRFELRSALATPLAADTLWGHLAWGLRYADGEEALLRWLDAYDEANASGGAVDAPLVISDPMPAGWWPRPLLPPLPRPATPPPVDVSDAANRVAKQPWVSHLLWPRLAAELSPDRLVQALVDGASATSIPPPPEPQEAILAHAAINRLTWSTASEDGGTLHTRRRIWYASTPEGDATTFDHSTRDQSGPSAAISTIDQDPLTSHQPRFDVWAAAPDDAEPAGIRRLFEIGLAGGYGKHASSGLGHLVVHEVSEQPLPSLPSEAPPNAGVLLGWATPKPRDPLRGFTAIAVRAGRVGGLYAIGPTGGGSVVRQKRGIFGLAAGSVLVERSPGAGVPAVVGQLMADVHPEDPAIRHYAMTLLLPCRLTPDTLRDALRPDGARVDETAMDGADRSPSAAPAPATASMRSGTEVLR